MNEQDRVGPRFHTKWGSNEAVRLAAMQNIQWGGGSRVDVRCFSVPFVVPFSKNNRIQVMNFQFYWFLGQKIMKL